MRHAKSSWKDQDIADHERKLNKRGKLDAPVMGARLRERNIVPDLIICSHAVRAKKTATIIAEQVGYPKEKIREEKLIYEAGSSEIIELLKTLDYTVNTVFVIGHNPVVTDMLNYLTDQKIANAPTCGMALMHFNVDTWPEINKAALDWFDYPKNLS
jgi:phosphohistidine phosphatase